MNTQTIVLKVEADVLHQLILMAHERDLTLNQLINLILRDQISVLP